MDKKGEIDYLSKILKPNLGIITNISYAHSKNFRNINGIAEAKSEIIKNIIKGGTIILNKDDKFYNFLKTKANNQKLKIYSFSIKDKSSYSNLNQIIKIGNKFKDIQLPILEPIKINFFFFFNFELINSFASFVHLVIFPLVNSPADLPWPEYSNLRKFKLFL